MEEYKSSVDTGKIWSIVRDAMLKGSHLRNRFWGNTEEYHSHIDAESAHYADKIAELFALHQAQEHPAPVRTSERLPTEADYDCMNEIWVRWQNGQWGRVERRVFDYRCGANENICEFTHWMPTGIRKPPALEKPE